MDKPDSVVLSKYGQHTVSGAELLSIAYYNKGEYVLKFDITALNINSKAEYLIYASRGFTIESYAKKEPTIIEYIEEIVPSMTQEEQNKWEEVRNNAAISIMNSLLETTQHSVVLEPAANTVYARVAVAYADSLIKELRNKKDWIEKILEA